MPDFLGIIPARYASTRFPGKPLADIHGKPMIMRVYERAQQSLDHVIVATDDSRIYEAVTEAGGKALITSADHPSGTDRCREAMELYCHKTGKNFDVVINIQGDEPFILPGQIDMLKKIFVKDASAEIATLVKVIDDPAVIFDPNKPKVILNKKKEALYFSRSPVPFIRGFENNEWFERHIFYHHIGLYAYKADVLSEITTLEQGLLEKAESLEQLRWLENGYKIKTAITEFETFGIDTPEDLAHALKLKILED
ncbi:MAG: 3-deoxy-manno-octulosonate cytidylyltransferase [Bacteroidales bacterium]|nr:3-deoxy-manno-octulosonate cytidylyltransferase [Bacteroidales bacterium]